MAANFFYSSGKEEGPWNLWDSFIAKKREIVWQTVELASEAGGS